ncbi:MAG: M20/M25/M40 family metallo-hydrolase [Candidatus Micrarchaeota archaeon]
MDAIQHLEKLVSINSVFPNEQELSDYCENWLKAKGFSVQRVDLPGKRGNLVARRGNPALAFYGHMDTVPVYGSWRSNPLQLTGQERLYGLGAGDMKGGIAAVFAAIEQTTEDVAVVLCSDEENISAGANLLGSQLQGIKFMISVEPTENPENAGRIMLGRRGRVVYRVQVAGVSAHGAMYEKGVNAIEKAAELVLQLQTLQLPRATQLGDCTVFVRSISGENTSLSFPENASFEIDAHLVVGQDAEQLRNQLEQHLKKTHERIVVTIIERATPYSQPFYVSPDTAGVSVVSAAVQQVEGKSGFTTGLSVADDNVFAKRFSVVGYGPVGGNFHSADEWVDRASLLRCAEIYGNIIRNFL